MAPATHTRAGADASPVAKTQTTVASNTAPPPLALPSPHAPGAAEGAATLPPRSEVVAADDPGPPFQGKRSKKSRRSSARQVVKTSENPPDSLKRTWAFLDGMQADGTWKALTGDVEIIPLVNLKGADAAKRFENNDLYLDMCERARARMKQHGLLKDGTSEDDDVGPRCRCGSRTVVSLSDAVQYWKDLLHPGTAPYFTSTEAGAADAARRGWRRIIPRHHHCSSAAGASNAPVAGEKVYHEDGIEGVFSGYLPTRDRETLITAVEDGYVNPATGVPHAPLRLWTSERKKMAWQKAGLSRNECETKRKAIDALFAVYWALTHLHDLRNMHQLGPDEAVKKLEDAGGKMIKASGARSRFTAVSEYAASVVRERARAAAL